MVEITKDIFQKILDHARASYPHECCGVLLGEMSPKRIVDAVKAENTNKERASDRYEMNPDELFRIEKEARQRGFEVVGIYHSHPDHPSRPSEFDRQRGWPEYSYIIVAVKGGTETEAKSWTFIEEDEPFGEEELKVVK
ncbi:MAG: M67 family metallopeptidase [Thermodesulfobacteriota bacterium]